MEENTISLQEIAYALKKRWKLIALITIGATLISAILSFFVIKPQYEATTKLFIGKQETQGSTNYDNNDVMMYQKLMKTYSEILKTSDLVTKATKNANLNYNDKEIKQILGNLTVTPSADTQILDIKYKCGSPKDALILTKAITYEFISESKKLIPNGNVQIIQAPQLPEYPVSPNKKLNILIAFVLGLMVGVGVVLLLEYLDNTFKSREELEKALDLPIIGTIPDYTDMK